MHLSTLTTLLSIPRRWTSGPVCSTAAQHPRQKASFKSIERALRPNNHLPANTANSSGAKTLHKALSRLSVTDDDFANIDVAREELENGEETKEGEDELEDALRALESYAAFQVTLVRHMESNPTFNVSPQHFYLRQARERAFSIRVVSPRILVEYRQRFDG